MASLISLRAISKQHGIQKLFSDLSYTIHSRDRVGVVGPNGSGKSSILKILAGVDDVDEGTLTRMRGLSVAYVSQLVPFESKGSLIDLIEAECRSSNSADYITQQASVIAILDQLGMQEQAMNFSSLSFSSLSGGQKKKVQLALKIAEESDLLLLDEPSNHLDLDSIIQLEKMLGDLSSAIVMISHDRYLLKNFSNRILEINPQFKNSYFACDGGYDYYLEERDLLLESDAKEFESLKNKVRTEIAWLRQGAKARSTKSKHRTETAHSMIKSLGQSKARRQVSESNIEFNVSGRKTKRLLEIEGVKKKLGDKYICNNWSLSILSGSRISLVGPNGSGKTTLLKLLLGEILPDGGIIRPAPDLKISYFSQMADFIDPITPLHRVLAPDGDSVSYQGRLIHVASWASRFQFDSRALQQPFGSLSGGEKAKTRIARLMLETPDVLLLDEPTNDLDIQTLEILEDSLQEFPGALVLVSHDRYLLSNVCDTFLVLDGEGGIETFASFEQSMKNAEKNVEKNAGRIPDQISEYPKEATPKNILTGNTVNKKQKLTYKEQRELDQMEQVIQEAEKLVAKLEANISSQEQSGQSMTEVYVKLGEAQSKVESLYARWAELEGKG